MPNVPGLPPWILPPNLATIVAEDGEWEDPSWDPLLLTVVGHTRLDGRDIPLAWQLSLWPDDAPAALQSRVASVSVRLDGHDWASWLLGELTTREPGLATRVHDDSDAATCVLWVETEADGQALMETAWICIIGQAES